MSETSGKKNRPEGIIDRARFEAMDEEEIERTSPPELAGLTAEFWRGATVVVPGGKEAISLRLDQDVLAWYRSGGARYQTRMNAVLRSYMDQAVQSLATGPRAARAVHEPVAHPYGAASGRTGSTETPVEKLDSVLHLLLLAVRVYEGFGSGFLPATFTDRTVDIDTGGPGVKLAPQRHSKEQLAEQSLNLVFMTVGQCSVVADSALDQHCGAKNPENSTGLGALRAILYQIRNAFAHDPADPRWSVKGKYRRFYRTELRHLTIECDFDLLSGQKVVPMHYGGLEGFLSMMMAAREAVGGQGMLHA